MPERMGREARAPLTADVVVFMSWATLLVVCVLVVALGSTPLPDWFPDQLAERSGSLADRLVPVQVAIAGLIVPALLVVIHHSAPHAPAHVRFRLVGPWPMGSLVAGGIVLPVAAVVLSAGQDVVQDRLALVFSVGAISIVFASAGALYARHHLDSWVARAERLVKRANRPRRAEAALETVDSLLAAVPPTTDRYERLIFLLDPLAQRLSIDMRHRLLDIAARQLRSAAVDANVVDVLAACSVRLGVTLVGSLQHRVEGEGSREDGVGEPRWRAREVRDRRECVERQVIDAVFDADRRLREQHPGAGLGALALLLDAVGQRVAPPDCGPLGQAARVDAGRLGIAVDTPGPDRRIVDKAALAIQETIERGGSAAILDPRLQEALISLAAAAVRTGWFCGDVGGILDPAKTWVSALLAGVRQGGERVRDELRRTWRSSLNRMMEEHRDREAAMLIELVITGMIEAGSANALSWLTLELGHPDRVSRTDQQRLASIRGELVSRRCLGVWMDGLAASGSVSDQNAFGLATEERTADGLASLLKLLLPLYGCANHMTAKALSRLGAAIAESTAPASPQLIRAWLRLGSRLTEVAQPDAPASVRVAASYVTLLLAGSIVRRAPDETDFRREASLVIYRWARNARELAREDLVDGRLQGEIATLLDHWEAVAMDRPCDLSEEDRITSRHPRLEVRTDATCAEQELRAWLLSQQGMEIRLTRRFGRARVVGAFAEPLHRFARACFLPGANLEIDRMEWHHGGRYVAERVTPWLLAELLDRDEARGQAPFVVAESSLVMLAGLPTDWHMSLEPALWDTMVSIIEDCASLPGQMEGTFDLALLVGIRDAGSSQSRLAEYR